MERVEAVVAATNVAGHAWRRRFSDEWRDGGIMTGDRDHAGGGRGRFSAAQSVCASSPPTTGGLCGDLL